jgi:PAS domain S-box-containing protein
MPFMKTATLVATLAAILAMINPSPATASGDAETQLVMMTSVMNSMPDIVFYKDTDGVYRGGNNAWAALSGKPLDQLIGKTDFDLFPENVAASFASYDKEMLAAGKARRNDEWLTYPDGRRVYVETLKTPWLDKDGKVLGVLGICREISAPAETSFDAKK